MSTDKYTIDYNGVVEEYLEETSTSQRSHAEDVGVSSEIVNRIINNDNPNIQINTLLKVLEPTDYTIEVVKEA